MEIIGIGICIGENLLLGISIGSVGIFLYRWNPTVYVQCTHIIDLPLSSLLSYFFLLTAQGVGS